MTVCENVLQHESKSKRRRRRAQIVAVRHAFCQSHGVIPRNSLIMHRPLPKLRARPVSISLCTAIPESSYFVPERTLQGSVCIDSDSYIVAMGACSEFVPYNHNWHENAYDVQQCDSTAWDACATYFCDSGHSGSCSDIMGAREGNSMDVQTCDVHAREESSIHVHACDACEENSINVQACDDCEDTSICVHAREENSINVQTCDVHAREENSIHVCACDACEENSTNVQACEDCEDTSFCVHAREGNSIDVQICDVHAREKPIQCLEPNTTNASATIGACDDCERDKEDTRALAMQNAERADNHEKIITYGGLRENGSVLAEESGQCGGDGGRLTFLTNGEWLPMRAVSRMHQRIVQNYVDAPSLDLPAMMESEEEDEHVCDELDDVDAYMEQKRLQHERQRCQELYGVDGTLCPACERPVLAHDGYGEWCEYCYHEIPPAMKQRMLTSRLRR